MVIYINQANSWSNISVLSSKYLHSDLYAVHRAVMMKYLLVQFQEFLYQP